MEDMNTSMELIAAYKSIIAQLNAVIEQKDKLIEQLLTYSPAKDDVKPTIKKVEKPKKHKLTPAVIDDAYDTTTRAAKSKVGVKCRVAERFIREMLESGPKSYKFISETAMSRGINLGTLGTARYIMGIVVTRDGRNTVWSLPKE